MTRYGAWWGWRGWLGLVWRLAGLILVYPVLLVLGVATVGWVLTTDLGWQLVGAVRNWREMRGDGWRSGWRRDTPPRPANHRPED